MAVYLQVNSGVSSTSSDHEENIVAITNKTPCPRCGNAPVMARHGSRYWQAKCPTDHGPLNSIEGHPMKTQREAWEQWEKTYEVMQSKVTESKS